MSLQESRWRKLLGSLKLGGREGAGAGHSDSYSLKHSHNCANSHLRVGVSNMMGYKKSNQETHRSTSVYCLCTGPWKYK